VILSSKGLVAHTARFVYGYCGLNSSFIFIQSNIKLKLFFYLSKHKFYTVQTNSFPIRFEIMMRDSFFYRRQSHIVSKTIG